MSNVASAEEKVLGRGDLVAMAVGNVIGGGIMSLTGIAIGMTGRSIVIAIAICSLMVLIAALPQFFVSSTIRMNGGFYTQAALFGNKWFSGLYSVVFISFFFGASFYSLAFADYVLSLVPGINPQLIAMLILTALVVLNILGVQVAAKAQYVMVILLILALIAYAGFGFTKIQPGYFQAPDFMTNGVTGIMSAAALMSMAASGATFVVNFGRQCKNPTKDIPYAIFACTIIVAILYIAVAVVAAGVLPVADVANQSLAVTAMEILPYPLYLFFIVCGAMIALVTSLNALLGWITPPIVQACNDGWFPKVIGTMGKRFNTPHWVLLIIYGLASAIILSGANIGTVATVGNFLANCVTVVIILAMIRMPKVVPELWKASKFHINDNLYVAVCLAGAGMTMVFCYYLALELKPQEITGTAIYLLVAMVYPLIVMQIKKMKNEEILIEVSYEEA